VKRRQDGDEIDESVETSPGRTPHPTHHGPGGGCGQRYEQGQRRHPGRDVAAFEEIGPHLAPVEVVVEDDPDAEVEAGVAKGEEADQAAELQRPRKAEQDAERRESQPDQEQPERPLPKPVGDKADGVRPEVVGHPPIEKDKEGQHAEHPRASFDPNPCRPRHRGSPRSALSDQLSAISIGEVMAES